MIELPHRRRRFEKEGPFDYFLSRRSYFRFGDDGVFKSWFVGGFSSDATVWYHYGQIDPTEEMHGCKEFWANGGDNCVTHRFEEPADVTIIERDFSTSDQFTNLSKDDNRYIRSFQEDKALGILPVIDEENNAITYGMYPQTVVDDTDIISALENESVQPNGWYRHDGQYYSHTKALPFQNKSNYTFFNGETVVRSRYYWFKCEPIVWKILSKKDDKYLLWSSVCLDSKTYHPLEDCVYYNSNIRSWAINGFYDQAFFF